MDTNIIGYVVVTENDAGPSIEWDGEVHEDRAVAEKEVQAATEHGHVVRLAVVIACVEKE